jgi:iron(III) transport system permease protein
MWGWQKDRTAIVGSSIAAFFLCCVLPISYLFITTAPGWIAQVDSLLLDSRQRRLLWTTTVLGAGAALGAAFVGVPLGVALARTHWRFKALQRLLLVGPMLLPPYVLALAWSFLAGSEGLVPAIAVLSLTYYPIPMLATESALRRIDGRLEEAALLVGPPAWVLWRVSLRLAAPAMIAAALLVFVLAISEFSVPSLMRVRVYTTEIFTAFAALYDFPRALLLSLPMVALAVLVAFVAGPILDGVLVVTRRTVGTAQLRVDRWKGIGQTWALVVILAALAMPLTAITREALIARDPVSVLAGSGPAIGNSLLWSASTATIVLAAAVWLGHGAARLPVRAARATTTLCLALFAVPSTVVGVSLIGLWNQPGWAGAAYGTSLMIVLGCITRFLPIAILMTTAVARAVPVSHEEAAAMSGNSWRESMRRVVLPQMVVGLAVIWTLVFVLAFGEVGVSLLVSPPGETTLPIRIYTLIANAPASEVALLALLQTCVILVPLAGAASVAWRWEHAA